MRGSSGLIGRAAKVYVLLGAALSVATVWLLRPEPPACTTLENGLRACMPVLVVPPPAWAYVAAGLLGAIAGLLARLAVNGIRGRRRAAAP